MNHTQEADKLTIRQLFSMNAQAAILSNADTLREITRMFGNDQHRYCEAIARLAVKHADALMELTVPNKSEK